MTLSLTSIKRPVLTSMMSLALILFGVISLSRLPVRELPNIDPPIVTVTTVYPGAGPEEVETQITEPIEDAVSTIAIRPGWDWQERRGLSVYRHALDKGVLLRPIGNVVYFMPPYVIDAGEIALMTEAAAEGIDLAARD